MAPRYLGLKMIVAKSFARIHFNNLINFGILPLQFNDPEDWQQIDEGDLLKMKNLHENLKNKNELDIYNISKKDVIKVRSTLGSQQIKAVLAGSLINLVRNSN
jgi:aconitate hydratase